MMAWVDAGRFIGDGDDMSGARAFIMLLMSVSDAHEDNGRSKGDAVMTRFGVFLPLKPRRGGVEKALHDQL